MRSAKKTNIYVNVTIVFISYFLFCLLCLLVCFCLLLVVYCFVFLINHIEKSFFLFLMPGLNETLYLKLLESVA